MITVTLVGLGEAGRLFGQGFASAGATVRGYDPFTSYTGKEIEQFSDLAPSLHRADLIISCVGAAAAAKVAEDIFHTASTPAIFADFNTLSPQEKKTMGEVPSKAPLEFVDVAVMAPVPREGHRTPLLAAGPGAAGLQELLEPLGTPVQSISKTPGDAASMKLIRSVFMKGLAALVLESLEAAEAIGSPSSVKDQIAAELSGDGQALLERLVTGTHLHAARRLHEVRAAADLLNDLGVTHPMTDATALRLEAISQSQNDSNQAEGRGS